jgi:phage shock protein A
MDKEMRVGYDELSLQVRQLEKKIEALEKKISELSMDHHKKPRH